MLLQILNTRPDRNEVRQSRWLELGGGEWFGRALIVLDSVRYGEERRVWLRIWHKGAEEMLSVGEGCEYMFGQMLIRPVALRHGADGLAEAVLLDVMNSSEFRYGSA